MNRRQREEHQDPPFELLLENYFHDLRIKEKPPEHLLQELRAKIPEVRKKKTTHGWLSWFGLPLVVATLGLGLMLYMPDNSEQYTTKGMGQYHVEMIHARRVSSGPVQKHKTPNGSTLYPGDFVQFVYQFQTQEHVLIVSVNERGVVSCYYPFDGKHSTKVPGIKGTLPPNQALELDDYLGAETIYIFIGKQPISFATVKASLKQAFQQAKGKLQDMPKIQGNWHSVRRLWIVKRKKVGSRVPSPESRVREH